MNQLISNGSKLETDFVWLNSFFVKGVHNKTITHRGVSRVSGAQVQTKNLRPFPTKICYFSTLHDLLFGCEANFGISSVSFF